MLEILLKSVFAFSEFKGESILSDRLIVEYINHTLKENLNLFDPRFYSLVALDAKRAIRKRVDANVPLENLLDVINMDALLDEADPAHASGEEALKYLAMEQLPDLVSKLEEKLGTKTYNIHKRFTDLPAHGTRPTHRDYRESTKSGTVVTIPKGKGGWIRTLHVPKAYRYSENRFQRARKVDDNTQELDLMYPDM